MNIREIGSKFMDFFERARTVSTGWMENPIMAYAVMPVCLLFIGLTALVCGFTGNFGMLLGAVLLFVFHVWLFGIRAITKAASVVAAFFGFVFLIYSFSVTIEYFEKHMSLLTLGLIIIATIVVATSIIVNTIKEHCSCKK